MCFFHCPGSNGTNTRFCRETDNVANMPFLGLVWTQTLLRQSRFDSDFTQMYEQKMNISSQSYNSIWRISSNLFNCPKRQFGQFNPPLELTPASRDFVLVLREHHSLLSCAWGVAREKDRSQYQFSNLHFSSEKL